MSNDPAKHPGRPVDSPSLASFSLKQAILMNLLFLVLILTGSLILRVMPVDVYPNVELDEATIDTFWLGASAEDVERLITDRIEPKLEDIRGVSRITSDSKPDASMIRVKFREDLSALQLETAFRQLRAAVEQVTGLPEDSEKPMVTMISVGEVFPLLWVVVRDVGGELGEESTHAAALRIQTILRDIPGVAKVDDKVLRDREVHILVDRDRLRKFDLTLTEVAAVLQQYNRDVPSGTLAYAGGEFAVRAIGQVATPQELGAIAIRKDPRGGHVYLRDVATIREGFERKTKFARFNGQNCKGLSIAKADDADSRRVADRVYAAVAAFQETLPEGLVVDTCADTSVIIRSRMRILINNLMTGVVLVFAALWLAMGARNALLAIIGIPFSFLCALICMHILGVSINAVSLFALVLCSGMIVDDAIVVLENIYRHVEQQRAAAHTSGVPGDIREAIVSGTNEVMWPVIASSATTVAAFLPMLLMTGVTGKFFSIIPKTVAVVLLVSLFECLMVLPVHYLTFGPRVSGRSLPARRRTLDRFLGWYDWVLAGILRHRYLAPLPLLGLGFLALSAVKLLQVDLFPSDFQNCIVDITAWDEASLEQTGVVAAPIEELVLAEGPETIKSALSFYGVQITDENTAIWRNNYAQMHIQLASTREVAADPVEAANQIRGAIQGYIDAHPDCGIKSYKVWAPQDGPPIGKPVAIRIECPDFGEAKMLAEQYKSHLATMSGVYGVVDNLDFGPQQVNLRLREDVASAHGLTQPSLSSALRAANDGVVVSTFKDTQSGENLDVRMMFAEPFRRTIRDLLDTELRCPGGYTLPLREIADVEMSQGYAGIPHFNGKRVVTVTAEVDTDQTSAQVVNESLKREFADVAALHPNVRITYGGEFSETGKSFESLKRAYVVALVVIYMLLATQFRSYVQPLVIIVTVPFASVGVVGGLLFNGYPLTIMTFIAIVGLTGVVVNDSIVLLDFVNRQRAAGMAVGEALREACRVRLRPILLTTVTTVLGLLPLAMGWGGASRIWSPFASSFAWGLAFSTLVTIFIVPACYYIVDDLVDFVRGSSEAGARGLQAGGSESAARASP